jgi:predicted secreted protein
MSDQGSTPPPPDRDEPGGSSGGYGAQPPSDPYGQPGQSGQQPGQYGQQPGQYGQQPGQYGQQPGQPYGSAPPPSYGGQPGGSPPPNYLVWAILTTLFCCLPLGIASIVFAAQVNGKYSAGDVRGAQEASEKAKKFAIWSAVAGLVVGVLYAIFVVAVAGSDNN